MRDFILFLGWASFFFIQLKYYLQLYTIIKTKNPNGLSLNYLSLNFIGYFSLTICYIFKSKKQDNGIKMTETNDILMAAHGTMIVLILILNILLSNNLTNKLTFSGIYSCLILTISPMLYYILTTIYFTNQITTFELFGFTMIICNLFKYVSLILHILSKRNMNGLNKYFLILDIIGNAFNLFQYISDYYIFIYNRKKDSHPFVINYVKLILCLSAISFNTFAYYIQYRFSNIKINVGLKTIIN